MAASLTLFRASPSSVTNRRYWIRTTAPGRSSLRQPPQPQRSAIAILDRCRVDRAVISLASTNETESVHSSRRGGKRTRGGKKGGDGGGRGGGGGTFRVSEVKLPWRLDPGKDSFDVSPALIAAVAKRMGIASKGERALPVDSVQVVRKSFDARKMDAKAWVYVVDVDARAAEAANGGKRPRTAPGRCEWMGIGGDGAGGNEDEPCREVGGTEQPARSPSNGPVVVVGSGPAGLFSALALAQAGKRVVLLERGKAVEDRGRDIGALFVRGHLNAESNLCYGEGGAGTWSDGKLTTRIGRNSDPVRQVLNALHTFGAPESVLKAGKPHLGTDRLVRILQGCRQHLTSLGVEIRFSSKVREVVIEEGRVAGVRLVGNTTGEDEDGFIPTQHVVLAVGHSARALYEQLHRDGVRMEAKPFAMGFRIEHPQAVIDHIQYGAEDAAEVRRGGGAIPVADYKLTATVSPGAEAMEALAPGYREWDKFGEAWVGDEEAAGVAAGGGSRGVYSFCMCPGGQVVPTSTEPGFLCVNGMSFSRRNSKWANSALVVGIQAEDWAPWVREHGPLAGVRLQEAIEQRAWAMGGGGLVAPVQRAKDFLLGVESTQPSPSSSYRLGVKSAPCHLLYPPPITAALRDALRRFEVKMPGFMHDDALLHGAETRTSAPVCIQRGDDMCSVNTLGLWPAGEGAGYAGGIISAAVDGMRVGEALAEALSGGSPSSSDGRPKFKPMKNLY